MFTIIYYTTATGNSPAEEFLTELEKDDLNVFVKTLRYLKLLEDNGNDLRAPFSKAVRDGLFELRVNTQRHNVRLFYFFHENNTIIITGGFYKTTQKIPEHEIEKASQRKNDYLRRSKDDTEKK